MRRTREFPERGRKARRTIGSSVSRPRQGSAVTRLLPLRLGARGARWADAHNQQGIDALAKFVGAVQDEKRTGLRQPNKLRMRHRKKAAIREMDNKWLERLSLQPPANLLEHGTKILVSPAAHSPCGPSWSRFHLDNFLFFKALAGVQFRVEIKKEIPRARPDQVGGIDQEFPTVSQDDCETLERMLRDAVSNLLQHAANLPPAYRGGKPIVGD